MLKPPLDCKPVFLHSARHDVRYWEADNVVQDIRIELDDKNTILLSLPFIMVEPSKVASAKICGSKTLTRTT